RGRGDQGRLRRRTYGGDNRTQAGDDPDLRRIWGGRAGDGGGGRALSGGPGEDRRDGRLRCGPARIRGEEGEALDARGARTRAPCRPGAGAADAARVQIG